MVRRFVCCLLLVWFTGPAFAVQPDEILKDPALEARARGLSSQLRCLVCQNQSIDDSDAQLARDLRILVRERIVKGETDAQVIDYLVSRYGEFVLLKPTFASHTIILWLAPALLLLGGAIAVVIFYRGRRHRTAEQPLDAAEQAALDRVLKD